jgi:F0F1-type ATP synthase membrane subunit a
MDFLIWVIIALCLLLYVTTLFIRSARKKEKTLWQCLKEWAVNVFDIISGGI